MGTMLPVQMGPLLSLRKAVGNYDWASIYNEKLPMTPNGPTDFP